MAYTVDILNALKVADNGLLSKIQIGGKTYEIKDLIAREAIGTLSAGLDEIAANYMKYTGQFADDAAVKAYVDAQVGAINSFDVHVMAEGEALPTASADTMYIIYLKPETDAASGAYVEYISIKNSDGTYSWEAIGSTKMDVTGFVTEDALNDTLADYAKTDDLGALAAKDSASGMVASQTISGVKATGTSAGSINVALEATEKEMASTGKFTPAGTVTGTANVDGSIAVTAKYSAADATLTKGDYTPAGSVTADFSHTATAATLTKGDYTPAGEVSIVLSGNSFNTINSVGTAAQFTEGTFTPATLDKTDVTANYAKEGIVGTVEDEVLVFTAAGIEAITATKVNSFDGGSKAADTFVANSVPTVTAQQIGVQSATFSGTKVEGALVTGVSYDKASLENLAFSGTKAEGALVTGVSYDKADIDQATFTGSTVDINAKFTGAEGDVSVAGTCQDYSVKTAEFVPAAIEVAVGDIVVTEKTVTVQ